MPTDRHGLTARLSPAQVTAVTLGFCPPEMRPGFATFVRSIDEAGLIKFVRYVCENLVTPQSNAPHRAVFKAFGGMKTHAHPDLKLISLRDKLKGKLAFQVNEGSVWEKVKTKDPPWEGCIQCEFLMILREFDKTNPGCRVKAGYLKQLENFLTPEFYVNLLEAVTKEKESAGEGGAEGEGPEGKGAVDVPLAAVAVNKASALDPLAQPAVVRGRDGALYVVPSSEPMEEEEVEEAEVEEYQPQVQQPPPAIPLQGSVYHREGPAIGTFPS